MSNLEKFLQEVSKIHRSVYTCAVDRPLDDNAQFWINVKSEDGFDIEISWTSSKGFGFYTGENVFGEKPNEIYGEPEMAMRRLLQLHDGWRGTSTIVSLWLKDIRKLIGMPQVTLAKEMSVQQAAISRLECRHDIKLSSLVNYLHRLGLSIEIKAFKNELELFFPVPKEDKKIIKSGD